MSSTSELERLVTPENMVPSCGAMSSSGHGVLHFCLHDSLPDPTTAVADLDTRVWVLFQGDETPEPWIWPKSVLVSLQMSHAESAHCVGLDCVRCDAPTVVFIRPSVLCL